MWHKLRLNLFTIVFSLGLSLAFGQTKPASVFADNDISTLQPGYIEMELKPGEKKQFSVTYYNAESTDLKLNYEAYSMVASASGNGFTLTSSPEYKQWITWVSPVPTTVKAKNEVRITFEISIPTGVTPKSYFPVVSIQPELRTKSENTQTNYFELSTVILINNHSSNVLGTNTDQQPRVVKFEPRNSIVFLPYNTFDLLILNNSEYYTRLNGKMITYHPNELVSKSFENLNPSQPLFPKENYTKLLTWDDTNLNTWQRIKNVGIHQSEVRLRIDNSTVYLSARARFFYMPIELVVMLIVLTPITVIAVRKLRQRIHRHHV